MAARRKHLQEIFDYVMQNKKFMPRTAMRYVIEKMSKELRVKVWKNDKLEKTK